MRLKPSDVYNRTAAGSRSSVSSTAREYPASAATSRTLAVSRFPSRLPLQSLHHHHHHHHHQQHVITMQSWNTTSNHATHRNLSRTYRRFTSHVVSSCKTHSFTSEPSDMCYRALRLCVPSGEGQCRHTSPRRLEAQNCLRWARCPACARPVEWRCPPLPSVRSPHRAHLVCFARRGTCTHHAPQRICRAAPRALC